MERIDCLKHWIFCIAVHTNDTEFKEQVGVVNKQFGYTQLCVFNGVCLCSND
jgi:hypothetical protein